MEFPAIEVNGFDHDLEPVSGPDSSEEVFGLLKGSGNGSVMESLKRQLTRPGSGHRASSSSLSLERTVWPS